MSVINFKWSSVTLIFLTALLFCLEWFPPYHTFSDVDTKLWILGLATLATIQSVLLCFKIKHCFICRVWSDTLVQVTGVVFIYLAGIFGAKYPPFSWAMFVYPLLGIIYLVGGRYLAINSRKLMEKTKWKIT